METIKAYKYDTFIQGSAPSDKLLPQKKIYMPGKGVLSYGLDGDHSDDFSTEQAEVSLAQEDIGTGSPRAKNIKKIDLPEELFNQLIVKNRKLHLAKSELEKAADSIIGFAENNPPSLHLFE